MAEAREAMAEGREAMPEKREEGIAGVEKTEEEAAEAERRKKEEEEAAAAAMEAERRKKSEAAAAMVVGVPSVGGIKREQKKVLAERAGVCKECGQERVAFVTYENVLEVFHMPLWRWAAQNPALVCFHCNHWLWTSHFEPLPTSSDNDPDDLGLHPVSPSPLEREPGPFHCWSCSLQLDPTFKFCTHCGSRQDFW